VFVVISVISVIIGIVIIFVVVIVGRHSVGKVQGKAAAIGAGRDKAASPLERFPCGRTARLANPL
jgi:hypothetical protein